MSDGIKITNSRGASFYITKSISPPLHLMAQWGCTLQFISSFNISHFIALLSDFDIATLCHRFTTNGQSNRQFIEQAIYSGQLNVLPEIKQSDLGGNHTFIDTIRTPVKMHDSEQKEARSLIVVRSDIKVTLRKIVDQERIQADEIDKAYQQQSTYGKASAHVSSFANGLYETGKSLLTWLKDVNDVVSLNQRMLRILMAAQVASHLETDNRYALFEKTLNALDKKELVEALGFDPSLVTTEKLTEVYSLAKLVHDDQTTRLIITQFIEDYIKAQHQLEWSEFSGGASFEVILTALLAVVTGGVGAVASLGAQARKISQLKKLGELLSELAELLKRLPKPKKVTLHQLKEIEDKKRQKAPKPVSKQENVVGSVDADDGRMQGESVVPNNNVLRQTGGGSGYIDPADKLYDAIRVSETDVGTIAANTGIKPQNIQKVKDHVFYNEHLLDRYVDLGEPAVLARFDSNLSQAEAWKRLESGTHVDADITWLKHETAERWYELKYNSGYTEAHDRVDWRWNGNPWETNQ